jgi:integrase
VVRERVEAAGIDPKDYSGHSLRAGLATSAAQAGVSSWKIRQQTGHASDAMLARYIRDGELFIENAAGSLL